MDWGIEYHWPIKVFDEGNFGDYKIYGQKKTLSARQSTNNANLLGVCLAGLNHDEAFSGETFLQTPTSMIVASPLDVLENGDHCL